MVEAIVSGVVERIGTLIGNEVKFLFGVSEKVKLLQTELKLMRSLVKDADSRLDESATVRQYVSEIREFVYDADDIIEAYALKVASRREGGMQDMLKGCGFILHEGITLHKVGLEIECIMTQISNLRTRFLDCGVRESQGGGTSSSNEREQERRQTFSHLEHDVVGFDDDLNNLVEFLLKEGEGNRVASIWGMGGLGKTTLAKMVYNHNKVKQHFDSCVWVFISQQCQSRNIWEVILFRLLSPSAEERDEIRKLLNDEIIEKLHQVQREKRCLVILDDIWTTNDWKKICEAFPVKNTGSKILLTSRNRDVALQADPRGLHLELKSLNEEKSWELFEKIAISWREDCESQNLQGNASSSSYKDCESLNPQGNTSSSSCKDCESPNPQGNASSSCYKEITLDCESPNPQGNASSSSYKDFVTKSKMEKFRKDIVGYCGGIPLVITILGGLLAAKQRKEWEDWLKHVKPVLYEQQDLQVEEVFTLKYNNLPYHLKPCFLYLGYFPKKFEIPTKKLIRMWMGEGFIPQIQLGGNREGTMEYKGEQYLQELVQRGMVQVGKVNSLGRIKTCRIHNLMRDFCISKATGENFLQITDVHSIKGSQVLTGKIRRLAIISESGSKVSPTKFNKYPYLRSLLYHVPPKAYWFKESSFQKFKLLRVLSLENFRNYRGELPKDIGCLIHLRFLSIKDSNIDKVPSSIGYLSWLQTLDLRSLGHHKLTCTDAVFILMFTACGFTTCCGLTCHEMFAKLHRGLCQSDLGEEVRLPNVFKKMEQLRHLYLPYEYSVSEKLELGNLCYLQTLVNVKPKTIQISTDFKLDHLRVLVLRNNSVSQATEVTEIVSRCPYIDKLNLCYSIEKLPGAGQFSPNLAKLTLKSTNLEEDPMTTLEKLANLKILRLLECAFKGKKMVCSNRESNRGFPHLQSLILSELHKLEEWTVEEGAMPNLCRLEIKKCSELQKIPNGLKSITSLRELEINAMPKSFIDSLDIIQHVPSIVIQD